MRAAGLTLEDACREARVPLDAVQGSEVSYADGLRLWEAVATLTDDPVIGHSLGARMKLHQVSLFGPILAHATDLRAGLGALCQTLAMALPRGTVTWRESDAGLEVDYARPDARRRSRHGVEMIFATVVAIAREATGAHFAVAAVELDAPPPPDRGAFDRFYGARVRFDADRDRLVFPSSELALPMLGSEPELARLVADRAPSLLAAHGFEERAVRACREATEAGSPTLAETAKRLGTSERSLQRRLSGEGTTFRRVRDAAAKEVAALMLEDDETSVEEVAERLGYSSRGGFERAFRRWYGTTPARWRRDHARTI